MTEENCNWTILDNDVTWLILLELDHRSIDQARLTCRHFYNLTLESSFWKLKLKSDYGLVEDRLHESSQDEYRFLTYARPRVLLVVERDDIAFSRLLQVEEPTFSDAIVAAACGRPDLLKRFREQGVIMPFNADFEAAVRGHFEVVKWLFEQCDYDAGYGNDGDIALYAAECGSLEIIKWDTEQTDFDERTGEIAAAFGHIHILEWIVGMGIPNPSQWAIAALQGNQPQVLEWLWNRGVTIEPEWIEYAIKAKSIDVLKWLIAHGIELDPEALNLARPEYKNPYTTRPDHHGIVGIEIQDIEQRYLNRLRAKYMLIKEKRRQLEWMAWLAEQS